MFENILLNRLENFLQSTEYQFGFKKGLGTDICIFALKDVINFYRSLNTPVFLCFMDMKSAFDLISYNKLFCILCERGAPKYLVLLLQNWYMCQKLFIRWGGLLSEVFNMKNGIRQGSCLSPRMFSMYIDRLNIDLKNSGIGCHVSGVCTNNFSYADDMVLVTPDAKSMNALLKICDDFASRHYITYSATKTEAMVIKPRGMIFNCPEICLSGTPINYVENFKYLGHIISSNFTDDADIDREIRNLYVRGNTIARKFGFLNTDIKCSLFKSYCYPLYTCSLWSNYKQSSLNRLRVAIIRT